MSITQKDIAREVGVSQATVSDVLYGRPRGRVSADTRKRIMETARRLGYRPNASAQALRTRDAITAVEHEERDASRAEAAREVDVGVDRISVAVLAQRRRGFVAIEADIRRKINQ